MVHSASYFFGPTVLRCRRWWLACCSFGLLVCVLNTFTAAQEPEPPPEPEKRLIEREPYDQLTVKDAAGGLTTFRISQLDNAALPGRKHPDKPPAMPLTVKLLDRPDELRQVAWKDIVKLELFEELALAEAEQLIDEKKTDQAYDNIDFVVRNYPKTQGLDRVLQKYLFVDAGRLYVQKRFAEALAVLEELHRLNKDYKPETSSLPAALDRVIDEVVKGYADKQNYVSARTLLARLATKYKDLGLASVGKWQTQFAEQAAAKRDEARAAMAKGQGRAARDLAREMNNIWPAVEGGATLVADISRQFPLVVVGVSQSAVKSNSRDLANWPARRTGRLLTRTLVEYTGQGPEGGRYACPWGKIELAEDGKQLIFRLQPQPPTGALPTLTGYDISQRLLGLADPENSDFVPAWGRLLAAAKVQNVMELNVELQRSFVAPQALLQVPPQESAFGSAPSELGPYVAAEATPNEHSFRPNPRYPKGPVPRAEIVERQFANPYQALSALRRGEIDVLDRLFPADVTRLKDDRSLVLGRYELPTTHLLLPNAKRPYLANRTFRRALIYAIDRRAILEQAIMSGATLPGCQVVSGPFSAGITEGDTGSYAYNFKIEPRPYDPRLAMVLVQLAELELTTAAKDKNEPAPKRPDRLVLAHPADEVARLACRAMVTQFKTIGLVCELKELPPGEADDPKEEYDLLYVEVSMPEPAIDARRLLGVGGPAIAGGSRSLFGLRQLDAARSFQEASKRLNELHTTTHDEISVLPLWQLAEYYAYQPSLRSLGDKAATLYQNVEQWQIAPGAKLAEK